MGTIFTLDDQIKSTIQTALDDLITELGKTCRLVYPPKYVDCANCWYDVVGKKSSNHYLHGGPLPFPNGQICPLCDGEGKRAETQSEEIKLLLEWDPKKFIRPIENIDIRVPSGLLQTKGYLTDKPKLKRCLHLEAQIPIEGYGIQKFKLDSEPTDVSNIIQGRYVLSYWKQI